MKETEKLPYASPVEALLLSRRNNLGQRVYVPETVGSRSSDMIRSEVRLVAAFFGDDPLRESGRHTCEITDIIANSHYRRSILP